MAIFYEHIKGCGPQNIYTSWIKWSDESEIPSTDIDAKYLPKILIGTTDSKKDFGNVITSQAKNQQILNGITIHEYVNLEYIQGEQIKIGFEQGNLDLNSAKKITFNATNSIEFTTPLFTSQAIETQTIKATTSITTPTANITTKLTAAEIESTSVCKALYFNATSDARAKENITPTQFSALAVVNSIPTYTFNYINKPQERVLGLIAQEAAQYNVDGFNMVDNLTASGEDGDYMQIKESKLVYVLWKAVQELTDEVESLKAQLNNLK